MLTLGWRGMFIVIGGLGLVILIAWLRFYREPSAEETPQDKTVDHHQSPSSAPSRSWASLFRERSTWGMVVGCFGIYFTVWVYLTWLPRYLEHDRHMSLMNTGWLALSLSLWVFLACC